MCVSVLCAVSGHSADYNAACPAVPGVSATVHYL